MAPLTDRSGGGATSAQMSMAPHTTATKSAAEDDDDDDHIVMEEEMYTGSNLFVLFILSYCIFDKELMSIWLVSFFFFLLLSFVS